MERVLVALQIPEDLKNELTTEGKKIGLSFSAYVRYLLINRHK